MYKILFTPEADGQLTKIGVIDPKSARIVLDHIRKLPITYSSGPFLKGPRFTGLRRNRVGRYRIIYRVLESERTIRIITVALRKSIYDQ